MRIFFLQSTKIFSEKKFNSNFEIIVLLFLLSKTFISITCINILGIAKYTNVQLISSYFVIFIHAGRSVGFYYKYFACTVRKRCTFEKVHSLLPTIAQWERGWANLCLRAPPHGQKSEGHGRVCSALFTQYSLLSYGKCRVFVHLIYSKRQQSK